MASHPTPELLAHYLEAYPWTGYTKPTAFLHTQVTEQTEDCVWVKLANGGSRGGTHSLHESEEVYEIYLYSADFDAWKELVRLLRLYPGAQPGLYTNSFETAALVSEFTVTGTGTVARSSTYKQAGSYSMKMSGADATYTYARKALGVNINVLDTYILMNGTVSGYDGVVIENAAGQDMCSVYFCTVGAGLILRAGTNTPTELGAANYNQWYHVRIVIGATTYSVWLDSVAIVTDKALENTPDTYSTATYKYANLATQNLYIDTHQHWAYPGIDLYQPRKHLQPTWAFLAENPRNRAEGVWKFTFTYHKLESVT